MSNSTTYAERINRDNPFGWTFTDKISHFKFEEIDANSWQEFAAGNRYLVFVVGAVYLLLIFSIQKWMKGRPSYSLRTPLFLWNFGLGLFSIIGFVRLTPGFTFLLTTPELGFYSTFCTRISDVPARFWNIAFILSKYVELGDTVFIVLRKRPLLFLQWFHHVLTLTAAYLLGPYMEPVSRCYIYMNFGIHALMYNYFALRAIDIKPPNLVANFITTLQLIQMFVGFGVNVASMYFYYNGEDCYRHPESIKLTAFMFGSFIILFGKLFYDEVIKRGRQKKEKGKKEL